MELLFIFPYVFEYLGKDLEQSSNYWATAYEELKPLASLSEDYLWILLVSTG